MISVEEKLNIFKQELSQKVGENRENKINEAKSIADKEEIISKQNIKKQKAEIIDRYRQLEDRNIGRLIAETKTTCKDDILRCKREIRESFTTSVEEAMKDLLGSKLYEKYLISNIKSLKKLFSNKVEIVLYVREQDKALIEKIIHQELADKKVIYKTLPESQIGGFFARDIDERVNFDFSLLNLVQENTQKITAALNTALDI